MLTLTSGKTLGAGDLSLLVRDQNNALIDPASISYSIFQTNSQAPLRVQGSYDQTSPTALNDQFSLEGATLVGQPKMLPTRASQGAYYIPLTIPTGWQGIYRVVWYLTQYAGGEESRVFEDFVVQPIDPLTTSFEAPSALIAPKPVVKSKYAVPIMYVRERLSDTNPDRNYHFRPPTPGKVVAGFNTRVGFIWPDATIIRMLDIAIAKLNTWNPKNYMNWTLDSVPRDWGMCAGTEAAAMCLTGEAARWAADEFSYSLNGISLDINKAALYQSLSQTLHQEFTEWAPLITANRPFSAGLRQQRWLLG
jgi:hypothetical protein